MVDLCTSLSILSTNLSNIVRLASKSALERGRVLTVLVSREEIHRGCMGAGADAILGHFVLFSLGLQKKVC